MPRNQQTSVATAVAVASSAAATIYARNEGRIGMNYPAHACPGADDDGRALVPRLVTCGNCGRSWCERCDPCPSALCHYCHGFGYSVAPIPPRQRRTLEARA